MNRLLIVLVLSSRLCAQEKEIDRLIQNELKMSFPSIYFKHNSTDYAVMPYTVDSCFKYIALHFNDNINSLVIWRDSTETEELTIKRIKKLNIGLRKHIRNEEIEIHSMENQQKISRPTFHMTSDSTKIQYLLSLNSVFDISKTHFQKDKVSKSVDHILHPKIWCWHCWMSGFHLFKSRDRELRKMERYRRQMEKANKP